MTSQKYTQIIFLLVCLAVCQGTPWWHGGDWDNDECSNTCENTEYCSNGNEVDISCPEGYMIDVLWAVYKGRGYRRWKRCGDPNACEKVRNLCNGENRCQFKCNDELFNETTCSCRRECLTVNYQCIPDPCKMFCCANGGVCKLDSDMMPMCECSGSWNGTHCEANPCDGMTCQNNGTCLVNMADGTAQCCCTSRFTGANCENAACNSMPACPANYERISIPAGVAGAGTLLQSCYRVITATAAVNYLGGSQLCAADNAAPVEFNTAGEFAAVSTLLTGTPGGAFFTGYTDAFNGNAISGINSGVPALGVAFPSGAVGNIDCGVITAGAAPTTQICAITIVAGVVCEISLNGATCVCQDEG